eukprot:m.292502 g.292502  ORF g.292502 m.292502 type:complete len:387 (-) comp12635_c0_seq2:245-1405(-)
MSSSLSLLLGALLLLLGTLLLLLLAELGLLALLLLEGTLVKGRLGHGRHVSRVPLGLVEVFADVDRRVTHVQDGIICGVAAVLHLALALVVRVTAGAAAEKEPRKQHDKCAGQRQKDNRGNQGAVLGTIVVRVAHVLDEKGGEQRTEGEDEDRSKDGVHKEVRVAREAAHAAAHDGDAWNIANEKVVKDSDEKDGNKGIRRRDANGIGERLAKDKIQARAHAVDNGGVAEDDNKKESNTKHAAFEGRRGPEKFVVREEEEQYAKDQKRRTEEEGRARNLVHEKLRGLVLRLVRHRDCHVAQGNSTDNLKKHEEARRHAGKVVEKLFILAHKDEGENGNRGHKENALVRDELKAIHRPEVVVGSEEGHACGSGFQGLWQQVSSLGTL